MTTFAFRIFKGAAWGSGATIIRIGSNILVLPILARFLDPRDFGLVQMSVPIIMLLMLFADVGIAPAVVRADNPSRKLWSSGFWTNCALATILAALVFFSAPLIGAIYNEPAVIPILQTLGGVLILQSFCGMRGAWLQRELQFKELAFVDTAANFTAMVAAITSAVMGAGAWALVIQQVTIYVVRLLMLMILSKPPLAFEYSWSEIKAILPFSLNLLGSQIVTFAGGAADSLILGRVLGATTLGFYGLAYRLMLMPVQIFSWGISTSLLPALSQLRGEPDRLKTAVLRVFRLVGFVVFPAMAGVSALSDPLIGFVLGEKMRPVAPILAVLAPIGAIHAIAGLHGPVYLATGKTNILFRWSLFSTGVIVAALLLSVQWGVMAVCYTLLALNITLIGPSSMLALSQVNVKASEFLDTIGRNAVVAVAMGMCVHLLSRELSQAGVGDFHNLAICVPCGVVFYGLGALALERRTVNEMVDLSAALIRR